MKDVSYIQYTIDSARGSIIRTKEGYAGPAGKDSTIEIDSTITLEPGSDAYVRNIGTPSEANLVFGIPTGQKGEKGDRGSDGQDGQSATIEIGTTTTGQPGTSALVENVGTSSAAVFNFTIPRGNDGQSATIEIGNVTSGSTPSVTNVGTSTNAVFDFVLEKGETGVGVPSGGTQGQILAKSSSTDYDTEWIDAPKSIADSFKEFGSKIVIDVRDRSVEDSKHIYIQILNVSPFTGGDLIDWGDGTTPTNVTSSGTYPHDYADFGTYTLTFYGNGHPQHNVDLSGITQANRYSLESRASIVGQGCLKWSLPQNSLGGIKPDFSAWDNGVISTSSTIPTLGRAYNYQSIGTELILPNAKVFSNFIFFAPDLKSVTFPAITTQITDPFSSRTPDNLQKIVMKGMTPPTISNLGIPSTTYILVPWSPDHSILNAYKAATGWSDYASRIYDGDPAI